MSDLNDWYDDSWDDDVDCSICGSEGYVECHDFIQCMARHTPGGECACIACGGTGLAKDQVIW